MGRRSENGPLAALEWLDASGLFVPPVSLRGWNELPRLMEVCAKPTIEFREEIAAEVHSRSGKDSTQRDAARGEAAVSRLLRSRSGAPPLVGVDVLVDDPDAADGDVPDLLVLEFAFPGGRKLSRAELDRRHQGWLDRAATKRSEVARLVEVFAPDYPGVNSENTKVRERAERELEAWAAFVALATEDSRMYSAPQAGRIGYVKLVPDIDWPAWTPVEGARDLLAAVDELWPAKCATYQELADALTASNLMTLSGKPFTKASVMKVLIAARLVSGSHPPWK